MDARIGGVEHRAHVVKVDGDQHVALRRASTHLAGQKHLGLGERFDRVAADVRHDQQVVVRPGVGDQADDRRSRWARRRARRAPPRPGGRDSSAASRACSSTTPPRDVLTSTASGFIAANSLRPIRCRVESSYATCRLTTSDCGQQLVERLDSPGRVVRKVGRGS